MVTVDSAMRASCETSLGRRQQGSEVVIHVLDARRGAASAHRCPPPMFDLATTYVSRRRGRLRAASVPVEPHQLAIPANPLTVSPRTPAESRLARRLRAARATRTVNHMGILRSALILGTALCLLGAVSAWPSGAGTAATPDCPELGSRIDGTGGRDNLRGTEGADAIRAGGGDDRVIAFGGDDCVLAGDGDDEVATGTGNNVAFGQNGVDRMTGEGGADTLDGGSGPDRLVSAGGDDSLTGGAGGDEISAGGGGGGGGGEAGEEWLPGGLREGP